MKSIVRQLSAATITITLLHFLAGCEEKTKEADHQLPQENTTELVEMKQENPSKPLTPQSIPTTPSEPQEVKEKPVQQKEPDLSTVYLLSGLRGERYELSLNKERVSLENSDKPFILIHLFNPDSNEAGAQAPYLSKLQKMYAERLMVIAIPTNGTEDARALRSWAQTYQTEYFISSNKESNILAERLSEELNITTSPSTLLYHQGKNYASYEGITPLEMITHDILQAGKK
ncbi:MAG: hypothetical protein ABXS92_00070 [Sulfurimonas sp.]